MRFVSFLIAAVLVPSTSGFAPAPASSIRFSRLDPLSDSSGENESSSVKSFQDTDVASKGFVSTLTDWVNALAKPEEKRSDDDPRSQLMDYYDSLPPPPTDAESLLSRIKDDYIRNNYLWSGKLDLKCFTDNCRFTDPTLSFVGLDNYKTNVGNLVPIVDKYCAGTKSVLLDSRVVESESRQPDADTDSTDESYLRSISDGYVETRWNMIGNIESPLLFWKPQVNVIGRTKFWFRKSNNGDGEYRIYFYDEAWEIPAFKALLQLVTPAGTITSDRR